jgi:DNA repair exonuclease SbcCD ATPase subunit
MNNVYFIAPLVGLLIFGSVYSKYARAYAARTAETQRLEAAAREEKKSADEAARANALETARVAQIRRSEERAEKAREEETRKEARRALEEQRNLAAAEVGRLRPQVALLRRELDAMEAAVARGEERTRQLQLKEQTIHEQVKQTAVSRAALDQLLERIETIGPRRPISHGGDIQKPDRG